VRSANHRPDRKADSVAEPGSKLPRGGLGVGGWDNHFCTKTHAVSVLAPQKKVTPSVSAANWRPKLQQTQATVITSPPQVFFFFLKFE